MFSIICLKRQKISVMTKENNDLKDSIEIEEKKITFENTAVIEKLQS